LAFTEDRAQLVEKYGQYVRSLANQVRKQFNARLDIEDLVSYGTVGLFEAAERFDPKVGANFLTFAHYRIKGAIFDGLRQMGVLKGPDQRALYLSERTSSYLTSAAARDSGPRTFADDVREVEGAVTSLAAIFACSLEGNEHLQIRDESLGPEARLEIAQLKHRVKLAIEKLPDNERRLLVAYYYESKTLEEAGSTIGQSKSWASRLHARAIERLKGFLAEEMELPQPTGSRAGPKAGSAAPSRKAGPRTAPATAAARQTGTR
jgi:RNA polymerase sigma factor for flagellar operon FliA